MNDDLERRLRGALGAAAQQAPPGLMDAIMRRRRRHRRRVGGGLLAVAACIALGVPAVMTAWRAGPERAQAKPARSLPARPARALTAAPGTVLSGCGAANLGAIGTGWKQTAIHEAGPLWLIDGGHSRGPLGLYVALVVLDRVKAGSAVVVRVTPAGRRYLRFLYGPADSMNPGTRYTMRSGESGVTFESCPGQGPMPTGATTNYYGGFLVKGARCVPVLAWVPGRAQAIGIQLGDCPVGRGPL